MFVKSYTVQINVPTISSNGELKVRTFAAEAENATTPHLRAVVGTVLWLHGMEGYEYLQNISVVSADKFFGVAPEDLENREGMDKARPIFPYAEDCNGLPPLPREHKAHPCWSFAPIGLWTHGATEAETNKRTKVLPFHTGKERGSSAPIKLKPTKENL